jgi:hypothetical protein
VHWLHFIFKSVIDIHQKQIGAFVRGLVKNELLPFPREELDTFLFLKSSSISSFQFGVSLMVEVV